MIWTIVGAALVMAFIVGLGVLISIVNEQRRNK